MNKINGRFVESIKAFFIQGGARWWAIGVVLSGLLLGWFYQTLTIQTEKKLYIRTPTAWQQIDFSFTTGIGQLMVGSYLTLTGAHDAVVPQGYYHIEQGENLLKVANRLVKGRQTPILLTFNNTRTVGQLAQRFAAQLMVDSVEFVSYLSKVENCEPYGLTPYTINSLFIPNTYHLYWNISMPQLLERMKREYDKFWTADRMVKLKKTGLSTTELIILSSIVEEETRVLSEQKIVAGVYFNRLRRGMPLQACPTAIFSAGDFTIKRVTAAITTLDSPYNTYKYKGLPIGPIRNPLPQTIDAVLDFQSNDYLYFCAKGDNSGTHNYASTYSQHQKNAILYQKIMFGSQKK